MTSVRSLIAGRVAQAQPVTHSGGQLRTPKKYDLGLIEAARRISLPWPPRESLYGLATILGDVLQRSEQWELLRNCRFREPLRTQKNENLFNYDCQP